ncbi:hypothetical protein BKA62DRAFT_702737 [Auriculariales sp. MPI-PUGE-AT-0066]|nr:hypothetical protein BKA62DRAFT_702737 [Auriculariales sp. MPI-PUGE-AT-0066]
MSDDSDSCCAACCGAIATLIVATVQQVCWFTKCGRGQDTDSRGCCDSCFGKSFNTDDFDSQYNKEMQQNARSRAASAGLEPQPMVPTPAMNASG